MKQIHSITVSVFIHEDEDSELKKQFIQLFPFEKEELEKIKEEKKAAGFEDKSIITTTITIKKQQHIKAFLSGFFSKLKNDDIDKLKKEMESRVDEHGNFYIRIAKESLDQECFKLIDKGKCVHIRIKVAAFPATEENYMKIMNEILESYINK